MRSLIIVTILVASNMACDTFVNGYDDTLGPQNGNAGTGTGTGTGDTNNATAPLVLANYNNGSTTRNSHGGAIQCEHCALSNDGNALHFRYLSGSYFGLDNSLNEGYCPVDLSTYSTLTFLLSSSVDKRSVTVMLHETSGSMPSCNPNSNAANNVPDTVTSFTITANTTMQTFSLDLTADANRKYVTYLEMDPQTLNPNDDYALNMITFQP